MLSYERDLRLETTRRSRRPHAKDRSPPFSCWTMSSSEPQEDQRLRYFLQTLRALDLQLRAEGGGLTVHAGRPERVVPAVATEVQARAVHITADFAPYGSDRDRRVAKALGPVPLIATGSPYTAASRRDPEARRPPVQGVHPLLPIVARPRLRAAGGLGSRVDHVAPARRAAHRRRSGAGHDIGQRRESRRPSVLARERFRDACASARTTTTRDRPRRSTHARDCRRTSRSGLPPPSPAPSPISEPRRTSERFARELRMA